MIKKIKYLLFIIICNLFIVNVYAASSTITAKASSSKIQVGDTVTVTVTVSSSNALGAWQFNIGYDSGIFTYVSSTMENGLSSAGVVSNTSTKNKSYTLKFKAKKAGTGKITINNAEVYALDDSSLAVSTSPATITVVSAATSNSNKTSNSNSNSNKTEDKSKSANNSLSSLSVDKYDISPKFSKNTTKYSVSVPYEVRTIKINARADDSKASVSGIGEKSLKEGTNKFQIVVTAENGNKKTYTLSVNVKDQNPLTIKIGDDEYTVVQKRENLDAPNSYKDTTVTIEEREIPSFYNDITKFTLVGLTNKDGDTNLYIYKDDKYTLYKEYKFSGITLYLETPSDDVKIDKAKEVKLKLNDEEITAYTIDSNTYPLIYGMNVETGEENWYTYDESENTVQKFVVGNKNSADGAKIVTTSVNSGNKDDKFKIISFILSGITGIVTIFLVIAGIKVSKQNKTEI